MVVEGLKTQMTEFGAGEGIVTEPRAVFGAAQKGRGEGIRETLCVHVYECVCGQVCGASAVLHETVPRRAERALGRYQTGMSQLREG